MTTGHCVETHEFLKEEAYALSSCALTYVALRSVALETESVVFETELRLKRRNGKRETL